MGVKGLLPKLGNINRGIHVKNLSGCKVGIEASSWLYQVIYSCSWELYTDQVTDRYITLFGEAIKLLIDNGVQPVVVFDGDQIPAKAKTKQKRDKRRQEAVLKVNAAVAINDLETAKRAASQAIKVTDDIVDNVKELLRRMDVPYVKAPYEADAQLAYMAQAGVIDYVITEDSDLLVYGAPKVIYKWKRNTGVGCLIEYNDLWQAFPFLFTRESFITLCVLSGCDYLDSLPNIGINRAIKFLVGLGNRNIFEELHNIATIIGVRVDVPAAYIESVKKAIYVFKHQIVYDFGLQQLCPCTPLQSGDIDYGDYAGDDSAELLIRSFKLKKVWLAPEDMNISRASDISWEAEEDADESFQRAYQTRQSGHAHGIKSIIDVVEWTVPGLPVLTLPLMMAKDDEGSVLAISLLEDEDPPTEVPFILFSTSSCYITYQEENRLLLWKWERMFTSEQLPPEVMNGSNTTTDDEWDKSSEESGDDIVMLLDDQEEQEDDNTTHYAFFKVMGVTALNRRQDALLEAKWQKSQGNNVEVILQPEPTNTYDKHAIQVVFGMGDQVVVVGYIATEMTQYIHQALKYHKIVEVAIDNIKFRAFNPPGYYARLKITKKGRWDNEVIRKSMSAR